MHTKLLSGWGGLTCVVLNMDPWELLGIHKEEIYH